MWFVTYSVRLSDVRRILVSALAVCLKALALASTSRSCLALVLRIGLGFRIMALTASQH